MLPKIKLPTIPTVPNWLLLGLPAPLAALAVMGGHPAIRATGLAGLSATGAIGHVRLAGRRTARVLSLAEGKWAEDLIATRAAALAEGRATERDNARAIALEQAQQRVETAESEMGQGFKRMESELNKAIEQRDKAIALAKQHQAARLKIESELATEKASLEAYDRQLKSVAEELRLQQQRDAIESDRVALHHQQAIARLEAQLTAATRKFEAATDHIRSLEQSLVDTEQQTAEAIAQSEQIAATKIQQLQAEVQRFKTAESERQAAIEFDQSLPMITNKIGREFKPVLVCGGQGSGKATTAAAVLHHYAGGVGCIPFVLDVSEGGQLDSTWTRAGIPSTDNVRAFIDLMEAVELNLGSRKHRTDPDFSNQPPIVFVIDELQTVALSLPVKAKEGEEKYTRENFVALVRVWHTRGAKYGCYLLACNQSDQIQNMRAGTLQIFNGGHFADFHVIRLNDVLLDRIAREPSLAADSLAEYLSRNEGRYVASFQTTVAGCKAIEPIAHPSHAGQVLGNRTPTRLIPIAPLAPCPRFVPVAMRAVYGRFCRSVDPVQVQTNPPQPDSNPNTKPAAAPTPTQPDLSPLAVAIDQFARSVGGSISPRDFVRNGGKFYQGARSLKAEAITHAFEVLERQGAGRLEKGARGALKYRASTTRQA